MKQCFFVVKTIRKEFVVIKKLSYDEGNETKKEGSSASFCYKGNV